MESVIKAPFWTWSDACRRLAAQFGVLEPDMARHSGSRQQQRSERNK
jgi:hypothetical protein